MNEGRIVVYSLIIFILLSSIIMIDNLYDIKVCEDIARDKLNDTIYLYIKCYAFDDELIINFGKNIRCDCYAENVDRNEYVMMPVIGDGEFIVS